MKKIICLCILMISIASLTACTAGGSGAQTITEPQQSTSAAGTAETDGTVKTGATAQTEETSAGTTTGGNVPEGTTASEESTVARLATDFGKRLQLRQALNGAQTNKSAGVFFLNER